ncbi:MAG: GH32 C-terminal domain-containing protein, partial [Bacteroidaceae bacterium]|nr:GH32 C-terminal domain-containing protein [Bacteroidaceae bacterium]
CGDLFFREDLLRAASEAAAAFASQTANLPIISVVGLPAAEGAAIYNAAAVVCGGKIIGIVRKRALPNYGEYYERRQFTPAPADEPLRIFDVGAFRFGVEICEDLWTPTPPLVLNERNGHSIYTSDNLRDWTYQSHVNGFWECPDLFPLAVDGNPNDVRWVMLGASNTYMIGRFDGKVFTPESGKHRFSTGAIYAAQTFNNVPDGRRIQIGWANIDHRGMPFRGQMLLPTELSLRTTKEGIRLVSKPIREVASLLKPLYTSDKALNAQEANTVLQRVKSEELRVKNKSNSLDSEQKGNSDSSLFTLNSSLAMHLRATLNLTYATSAGLKFDGQTLIDYDLNRNTLNGQFYSPQDPTSLSLTMDIYIDRTSIEVFIDDGLYSFSMDRKRAISTPRNPVTMGFEFWGGDINVTDIQLDAVESCWER